MCVTPSTATSSYSDDALVMKVGVYENPPKVFADESGNVSGFFPDVLEYIADDEGWILEYVFGNWTQCLARLGAGEIDIMVDVAYSADRLEEYDFTNESMLLSWGVVYSRLGLDIQSIPELDGTRMAVMKESIHTAGEEGIMSIVEKFQLNVTFVEVDDYIDVFELIDAREVDVGVVNRVYGGAYEDDYDVVRTPIIFNPADLRFALPKNATLNPYLIDVIDGHLMELKMDPDSVYYQSLRTYMPNLFEGDGEVPSWLVPALLLSFGVLAVIVSMNLLLRRQVKARTAELRAAYSNLVNEKNKSDFYLDLMSHDIANISQGIYTYAALAHEDSSEDREMEQYTSGILQLIMRAFGLIGTVRLLSKLGDEKKALEPVRLIGLLRECIEDVRASFPNEDIVVGFDPPCEEMAISAEPHIKSLFMSILNNAVRHQRKGRKVIEVDVTPDEDMKTVTISVADHGPGISDERKPTLFRRYESTGDQRFSGIGLLLAKELVKRYSGTIEVCDRVKGDHTKGAKFVITLPLESCTELQSSSQAAPQRQRTRRLSHGG